MKEGFIDKFQHKIGIKFDNLKILELALTHSSYANEHNLSEYNERLEFLGDAVVDLVMADYLYRNHNENEGTMTKVRASYVCENALY